MATPLKLSFRVFFTASVFLTGTILPRAVAQSAPVAIPVPINSALVGDGITPLAVNACGGNAALQASSIPTTSGSSYGDNCPAAGGLLSSPQGAAVDSYGNVYVADYSDRLVRVVYNGGSAVANMISAANSGYLLAGGKSAPAPTPAQLIVGDIYTIAGLGSTAAAYTAPFTNTDANGKFLCTNISVANQTEALDSYGDGCPGAAAPVGARDVALDSQGNLFLTDYTNNRIRVLCVSCTATSMATKLIQLENPGVTPVNGSIYTVAGYSVGYRDGPGYLGTTSSATSTIALLRSPSQAVVSGSDDVYIADNINNAVRVLYNGGSSANAILTAEGYTGATAPVVGNVYTVVGDGCAQAPSTTNGSATTYECVIVKPGAAFTPETVAIGNGAATGIVWSVYLDPNGNLFYTSNPDSTNDRVKVLYGGGTYPLTFPNATYATLKTGDVYSFAGQGTLTQNGVAPGQEYLNAAESISGDASGNLFFFDYGTYLLYETYAQNGLTAIIGGGNAITTPVAGAYCNGGTTGPTMTDAFYDGCPLTQVKITSPRGPVVSDNNGNLYFGDSVGYFVRKFSYNPTFPTTAVGAATAAQPYAFTFTSAQTLAAPIFRVASDFSDAGNDTCAAGLAVTGASGNTCVVNVKFTPSTPGLRTGAVDLSSASAVLGGTLMSGNATGAALAVDPATSTTTGATYTPNGIAVDGAARVYFTDGAGKSAIRYTGGAATTVATGFKSPTGIAADAAGNVFVADSTANTVTEVPITGAASVLTSAVSSPHGLAADGLGRLYIADTGNNRVLVFGPGAITPTVAAFTGLSAPQAVAIDSAGSVYALDSTHVVKLTAAGVQSTVATSGGTGLAVDAAGNVLVTTGKTLLEYPAAGGTAVTLSSSLLTPTGAAIDGTGNIYVSDSGFSGFIELQRTLGYYKFVTNPATTTVQLSSIGTATVSTTAFTQTDTTDYAVTPATTNGCSGALPTGTTCALLATFNPKNAGVVTDLLTFTAPVSNGTPTMTLTTVSLVPAISLAASPLTLTYGSTETLTATVYGPSNTSGTVIFYSGATQLASVAVTANATATYGYAPAVGTYSITATFTPTGATAPTVTTTQAATFTVNKATPSVQLVLSTTSGYTTTSVVMTATVTAPASGTPTGTVSFYAGTTMLGTATLTNGVATITLTGLPVGTDCITAAYAGDTNFNTFTSSCTTITIAAGFGVTASSSTLAFQKNYQEAQTYLVVNPGGRTDTLTFACSGLPSKISCAFNPVSLPLAGVTTAQNVQLLVSNSGATASLQETPQINATGSRTITLAMLPLAGLAVFLGLRRRRLPMLLAISLLALFASSALTGCGNSPAALQQASGTYPFSVAVNSGTTTLQTVNLTLTIP